MKKALVAFAMLMMAAPAHADITSRMSSSVQLNVDAAATQVERVGNSYSVSGTNIDVTTFGGMSVNSTTGAATFTEGAYDVSSDASSFSFTESLTVGDSFHNTSSDSLSVGNVHPYSNQTSTAGGVNSYTESGSTLSVELGGDIDSGHGISNLSAGGSGTSAIGQFVTEITID